MLIDMNRKIKISLLGVLLLVFGLFYRRANQGYPKENEFVEISKEDTLTYDGIAYRILDYGLTGEDYEGYPIFTASFEFVNKTKEARSALNIGSSLVFYQDFESSIVQNINESGPEFDLFGDSYNIEDLDLKAGEKKDFTFKYIADKKIGSYDNFIYIDKNLYMDEYMASFEEGKDLYKIIKLGDIYE